jgi:hypothetical protein
VKRLTFFGIIVIVILIVNSFTFFSCSIEQSPTTTESEISSQTTSIIKEVKWNLSGTVMPKPKYGSQDILDSERASLLTMNQTEKQVQITGEMSGLRRNTSYNVLLAKGYTPKSIYPGLFTDKIDTFTFISTPDGLFRWTFIIFKTDFPGPGTYTLSVWINETTTNVTILISDNFDITIK